MSKAIGNIGIGNQTEGFQNVCSTTLKIECDLISHLIGEEGWRIEKIKRDTNSKIVIGKDKDDNDNVECCITAKNVENLELAKAVINKFIEDFNISKAKRHKSMKTKKTSKRVERSDVSVSVTLCEGGKPVEAKAGYRNGKLCCLKCKTALGEQCLRARLTNHAKKCPKMVNALTLPPKPVPNIKNAGGLGWTCDRCLKQFAGAKLLNCHLEGKGTICGDDSS